MTELNKMHYFEDFYFSFIQFQYQFYKKVVNETEKIIFKDVGFPQELILGAGLIPAIIEVVVGMIPPSKFNEEVINKADKYFYDSGVCSFNKFVNPVLENGDLPLPRAFVSLTACQDASNNFSTLSKKFNKPYFSIDIPYKRSEDTVTYLAEQYEQLFYCLCEISGTDSGLANLKEVINNSNKASELFKAANEFRKKTPSLFFGGQMLKFMNLMMFFGTQEVVKIANEYYETCKKRSENLNSNINEKARILWCNLGPMYDRYFYEYMEKELGAIIAFEEINYSPWERIDENNPFVGLAKKTLDMHIIGDVSRRVQCMISIIKEYQIDGVIFFSHMNCRLFNPKFRVIKEYLDKFKIPILELSGDCIDKRNYSRAQLTTRLEAFVEMIKK